MIADLRSVRVTDLAPGAVVVIGSGAAGLAVAERLADHGRRVLLLESGHDPGDREQRAGDAPARSRDLNSGAVTGQRYDGLLAGRSRALGGSTELWHGQCMRLHDLDLRARDWVPGSGWPIDPRELDEPYRQAESWFGLSGLGYGAERWDEHPDLPRLGWDERHIGHDFTEYTPRPVLWREHRRRLQGDPRITVLTNATVTRIRLDGDVVTGVEVVDPSGTRQHVAAGEVVLAAGAIENARLLLLSDPAGVGLGTGRAHTGRWLQDHPIIRTAQVIPHDFRVLQDRFVALHRGQRRLFPKLRLTPSAQERHGLVDATAVFVHDHDDAGLAAARRVLLAARARRRDAEIGRDLLTALRAPGPVARDAYRRYVRGLATAAAPSAVWLQIWLEQVPDPSSRVTLGDAVDRFGLRRAAVDWRVGDQEIRTSRRFSSWIAADLRRLGIAEVRDLAPMHDDDAWRAAVTDAFHPSGTTRMSSDPHGGVVDADLQVHGVPGLFVVGGSVLPVAGYANPTLTLVALAFRLADRIGRTEAGLRSGELVRQTPA